MPWTDSHIKNWLKSSATLTTADGKSVRVLELQYSTDNAILSAWAKHFRNHYCLDAEIDDLCTTVGLYPYKSNEIAGYNTTCQKKRERARLAGPHWADRLTLGVPNVRSRTWVNTRSLRED